ncbi:PAS domain S-box protein [Leptolyngbya sp. NK1-12]|uniref:PAS domain-containing hybrid sensor histidine kinase/response regulator n=1 Tax=Leptolyngbya sp. NK1-12 TaxID=2547451 RepID=UPI00293059A7|nr:PAS domain S-box protein [Leptolyngbya sp. NK1-12]
MKSDQIVSLSEYHRLPQESQTSDFYKRLLEVICNNATLALFIMDEHQQCIYMNPAAETLTGYRLDETKGRTLHDVIHHTRPDGRPYPLCECPIDRAFPQNNQEQGEEVFIHKDGHFYPVAYTASPIREDDRVIGTIIEVRDITQEKLAAQAREEALHREQQLRIEAEAAQQRLTHLLEHMSDAFVALDQDWRIIYLNAAAERINHKPRAESLGKTHWEEWPASVGTAVEHQYRRAMAEQVPVHFEHRYYSAPDYDVWLEIYAYPSQDGLGIFYRDVTARKRTEAELQTLNQQLTHRINELQTLFDLLPIGVAIAADPDCHTIRVNPYLSELIRVPVTANASQSAPPEVRPAYRLCRNGAEIPVADLPMQYAARHNTEVRDEVLDLVHPDGTLFKLLSYCSPLWDEQGNVRGVLAAFIDITQRVLTETALRKSEEQLRLATEGANLGMWYWDVATDSLTWTDRAKAMFGLPAHTEMTMQVFLDAVHPDDRSLIQTIVSDLQAGPTHTENEYRTQWPDGTVRWILARGSASYDANGTLVSTRGVLLDITDRKRVEAERNQIEAALRQSEDRLRMALESAQLGTWDWNLATNELVCDTTWKALFGLPADAQTSIDIFYKSLHPDERDRVRNIVQRSFEPESGGHYDAEYRTIGIADGIERWVAAKGQVYFNSNREPVRFIGTVLNITEHKRAEAIRLRLAEEREQLLAREQAAREAAEAASRIKDEFLAVVSHELRTPLNPILGWSKLLRSRQLDAEKTDRALEVIERNAQMQAQLINDLLDVSRILRGKLSLDTQPVDLVVTIQAAMETVRLAADAKSIQIHTQFAPDVGPVSGDAGRLQQVVWNLLSNAVKFTPEGGRVDIRLERSDSQAQITVTDTGKGIPADFLPYVFDQFRQESSATTRHFGGLGLGLAIVRYLVELHGGAVQADSPGEGQGATFTVTLPLMPHQPATKPDPKPSASSLNLQGTRILVVDDDDNTREFLAFLLELHGARVIATATASEALTTLTQFKPEVLLSDIGMPYVDGYMLMRQIRALPPEQGGTIPAIALTAYAGEIDYQQAMAAGFQRHIAKPIEPQVLIGAIANLLSHS